MVDTDYLKFWFSLANSELSLTTNIVGFFCFKSQSQSQVYNHRHIKQKWCSWKKVVSLACSSIIQVVFLMTVILLFYAIHKIFYCFIKNMKVAFSFLWVSGVKNTIEYKNTVLIHAKELAVLPTIVYGSLVKMSTQANDALASLRR